MGLVNYIKRGLNNLLGFAGFRIVTNENSTSYRDFVYLQNFDFVRGVLHVGAHFGEERFEYASHNLPVMWVEAVPAYFDVLSANIAEFSNQEARALLLSDQENVCEFFIASNEGASSSIYELSSSSGFENMGLKMVEKITLNSVRLDSAFKPDVIGKYDHWVIDVQGAELNVLQGAGDLIKYCNSLLVEVSRREIYRGGTDYLLLISFLKDNGFLQIWEAKVGEHMDVFFVRRNFGSQASS
jgi:FkbM family methyltransferase